MFVRKPSAFSIADMPGLWRVHWQVGHRVILSTFYTRHDQACMMWAVVSAAIFGTAQFMSLSWLTQAMLASGLTAFCIVAMVALTLRSSTEERLTWVLYGWSVLMLLGAVVTDLSLLLGWGRVLGHVCHLWLGISGVGYLITGWGMRSRTFLLLAVFHLLTLQILPAVGSWQPLTTGIVISGCALLIAEVQWDANGVCGHPIAAEAAGESSQQVVGAALQNPLNAVSLFLQGAAR